MTCIIVEDQPPAQRVLKKFINDEGSLDLVGVYADALEALGFLRTNPVDLIFLDVHLPKLSGIDFLKILSPRPKVILTTAFSEYALQGYEFDITDYLLKPFSFERFVKAVNKAIASNKIESAEQSQDINQSSPEQIFIKSGSDYVHIFFEEVLFIKADGDYTLVMLKDAKHLVSHPLRYWLEILPDTLFGQVHKSYIVNANHIRKISGGIIYLNNHEIPIGRTYKDSFFERFLKDY